MNEEGPSLGLILSLSFDPCLLLHPEQIARIENKLPAYTRVYRRKLVKKITNRCVARIYQSLVRASESRR